MIGVYKIDINKKEEKKDKKKFKINYKNRFLSILSPILFQSYEIKMSKKRQKVNKDEKTQIA